MSYLLVILIPHGAPPDVHVLHACAHGGDYSFDPLAKDGRVWTLDADIWRITSKESIQTVAWFAVGPDEIDKIARDGPFLVGVVDKKTVEVLGRDEPVDLLSFDKWLARLGPVQINEFGFDVLDSTGLSALTNVGFPSDDCVALRKLNLSINQFGLLVDEQNAERFVMFADEVASEHAPFSAVKVIYVTR